MTDLRELSRAVQRAEFPSHEFAAAVREWIAKATERMEPEPATVEVDEIAAMADAAYNALTYGGIEPPSKGGRR